jgi:two-component system phosphate regulon sensor histidine kinase PhoR
MNTLAGRIFRSIFLTAVAVVLFAGVLVTGLVYAVLGDQLRRELLNTVEVIEAALPDARDEATYLGSLELRDIRVTWIATDGSVLYDSVAPADTPLENHLDRPEVQGALANGSGMASRHSQTLDVETIYLAHRLPDGTILRVAGTQKSILGHMATALVPGILILVAVAAIAAASARFTARRILRPLGAIDFEQPLTSDTYPELAPLLTRLNASLREIAERGAALDVQQSEFDVVTNSMREGLVLTDPAGQVLFINAAAARLFESSASDVIGRHLLTLNRSDRIQQVVESATGGQRAEGYFEQAGRVYQLLASPVLKDGQPNGAALLVLDITEWYQADVQRREFTANVSHELKTPLTVINGYAELMERGMVEPADVERFTRLIHDEGTRLITLIDDIITLSQLDETEGSAREQLAFESVDLIGLAHEVCERLDSFAQGREVTLTLLAHADAAGATLEVEGIPILLSRMLYNLVENGIRYTNPGGSVSVELSRDEDAAAVVRVRDTGIGIPAELHTKVFERFFCVDRSRSRNTGGTGLGLAIVKHTALLHNATIDLQSTEAQGTTITLRFPQVNGNTSACLVFLYPSQTKLLFQIGFGITKIVIDLLRVVIEQFLCYPKHLPFGSIIAFPNNAIPSIGPILCK